MNILLTGAAGFIGFHAAKRFLEDGHEVTGIDNLNAYYSKRLKQARLSQLEQHSNFTFDALDLAKPAALTNSIANQKITHILHLAAQPGVQYSLQNPHSYIQSNVMGHLNILEYARHNKNVEHVVYASSSSIYGEREAQTGFKETDRVREPASLYAATKLSAEMISESYARLYNIPQTGLRFFTVYGPWGRPDMAYWLFTQKILDRQPITLYAPKVMKRDFTYIDDIVDVLPAVLERPPKQHEIYNLGNSAPNTLYELVNAVETACGQTAETIIKPQRAGDVRSTFADTSAAKRDFNFSPNRNLTSGIANFVGWYLDWNKSN